MEKHIIIACCSPPNYGSGINTYSKELAAGFTDKGFKVTYVSPKPEDMQWLNAQNMLHFDTSEHNQGLGLAKELIDYIKSNNILAVINNDNPVIQSIFPALECVCISVGHLGHTTIGSAAVFNKDWCDYIVGISSDMQNKFVNKYGILVPACPVIHNGMKDPFQGKESDLLIKPDKKNGLRIICPTGSSKRKGGAYIYKLCKLLENSNVNAHLDWFGDISENIKNDFENNIKVHIHGTVPRDQLLTHLSKSDIYLMASLSEGCPMSLIEAMSYGVMPIVSDGIGAMRWMVKSGGNGYVCTLKNWHQQAFSCITEVSMDYEKLIIMRKNARDSYKQEYQISRVVEDMQNLFERPRIRRNKKPEKIKILKWHRMENPGLRDKMDFRRGKLRILGELYI